MIWRDVAGHLADGANADLAGLAGRRVALRQSAGMPDADPRALLEAAFAELDAAVEMPTKLQAEGGEPALAATRNPRLPAAGR